MARARQTSSKRPEQYKAKGKGEEQSGSIIDMTRVASNSPGGATYQ
jgi:hypothetical protein